MDRHAAGLRGGAVALRWVGRAGERQEITYDDLRRRTSRFANVLRRLGVGKGDVVATLMGRTPAQSMAALGTLKNVSVYIDTVMTDLMDLVARARRGTLRSSELADPTITVTNLGDLGVEAAFAVIYPPQVAIVGFGKMLARPWVVDGRIEPRTLMTATVSADHRAVDGRRAATFLSAIERQLQTPEQL